MCLSSTQVSVCFPLCSLNFWGHNPPFPHPPSFPEPPLIRAAQEELVLAALRIEALQVAKNISQCPSLSALKPQVLRSTLHRTHLSACSKSVGWRKSPKCLISLQRVLCRARMSVFQPAPKHTVVSLTANSWPSRHGGCTTTSSVLPTLKNPSPPWPKPHPPQTPPTTKTLTWLHVSFRSTASSSSAAPSQLLPLYRACIGNTHVACS